MRCLHCNKKLSLLKLAKGDSFCSPEHFDAYQLQLSKNAYERLRSVPDEETAKAPLVFTPVEVPSAELEADSALARLSAFRAPEKQVAPPPLVASVKPPAQVPPYAGFLASPLPPFPPQELVLSVLDANEPVAAPRDLAFPVHDVDATVCILNLYLRLGLSETPPRGWTQLRDILAPPEKFPGAIEKPALVAGPCVPSESEAVDNAVPGDPVAVTESIEPPAVSVYLEPVHIEPDRPEPLPIEPNHIEAVHPEVVHLEAVDVEPVYVEPVHHEPVDIELDRPEPVRADSLEADHIEPWPAVLADAVEPPPVHVDLIEVLPALSTEPGPPATPRLAFLVAPSFQDREGTASHFDDDASSVAQEWKLAPVLDHVQQSSHPWSGWLPPSTGFSRTGLSAPKNAAGAPVQSAFALPAAGAMLLPKNSTVDSYQWQALDASIDLSRPPREVVREVTKAVSYAAPVPAPVRPNAILTPGIDLAQILSESANSLLWGVLETRPRGQEPAFRATPADSLGVGVPSILASFPEWEGFASGTWENGTGRLSLPAAFADAQSWHCLKRAWRQSDIPPSPNPDAAPVGSAPGIHLLAPTIILDQPAVTASALLGSLFERAFNKAASADFGQSDWSSVVATTLLPAGDIPSHNKKIGLCSLTASWSPCQPSSKEVALFRFLPVRKGAILPSARAWPRLGALS